MKIYIHTDSYYPFHFISDDRQNADCLEVDDKISRRWKSAMTRFHKVQKEIEEAFEKKAKADRPKKKTPKLYKVDILED